VRAGTGLPPGMRCSRSLVGIGVLAVVGGLAVGCGGRGEEQGAIGVRNAAGRSGAYYVPAGPRDRPVPVMVVLHSTGASGEGVLDWFRGLAAARGFAIIAPESGQGPDGQATWQVGDRPGVVTSDLEHVLACVQWVREHTGIEVDAKRVLIVGHSGGGSSAPYIASNRPLFSHFAVLHGGVFAGGIGPRRVPAWISTGDRDRVRPPVLVQEAAAALERLGFPVTFQVFPGTHGPSEAEMEAVVRWWLDQ
jgi:predicted esterase